MWDEQADVTDLWPRVYVYNRKHHWPNYISWLVVLPWPGLSWLRGWPTDLLIPTPPGLRWPPVSYRLFQNDFSCFNFILLKSPHQNINNLKRCWFAFPCWSQRADRGCALHRLQTLLDLDTVCKASTVHFLEIRSDFIRKKNNLTHCRQRAAWPLTKETCSLWNLLLVIHFYFLYIYLYFMLISFYLHIFDCLQTFLHSRTQ